MGMSYKRMANGGKISRDEFREWAYREQLQICANAIFFLSAIDSRAKLTLSFHVVHKARKLNYRCSEVRRIGVAELAAEKNPPADKSRAALVR